MPSNAYSLKTYSPDYELIRGDGVSGGRITDDIDHDSAKHCVQWAPRLVTNIEALHPKVEIPKTYGAELPRPLYGVTQRGYRADDGGAVKIVVKINRLIHHDKPPK